MSTHVSSRVWAHCRQTGDRLLLMLALADYSNDEGICWPSQASLAARTRCSERGIQKMIDALAKAGDIEMLRQGGGRGVSAKYRLSRYRHDGELPREKGEPQRRKGEPETGNEERGTPEQKGERGSIKGEPERIKGEQAVPPNHQEPSREPSSEDAAKSSRVASAVSERALRFAEWFKTLLPETVQTTGAWKTLWAKCYDDLIRLDHRTPEGIAAVCEWARKDGFWAANFLSPLKLRKSDRSGVSYFDVIEARMNAPVRPGGGPPARPRSELHGVKILPATVS